MQIFRVGQLLNAKKRTCKFLKDWAEEVGVNGLSVGGGLLGEVGIQSTPTSILLTFCKIPSSAH